MLMAFLLIGSLMVTPARTTSPSVIAVQSSAEVGASLAGTWLLRWEGNAQSEPVGTAIIEMHGSDIEVRGNDWSGRGKFEGQTGHYQWSINDGRTGHTTLWLDGKGLLHGQVRGALVYWDFIADRK
jgi:hypothetical protein